MLSVSALPGPVFSAPPDQGCKRSVHLECAAGPEIVDRLDLAFADGHDVADEGRGHRWPGVEQAENTNHNHSR
jgi:hypothetical protein